MRFGLCVAAVWLVADDRRRNSSSARRPRLLRRDRSFFGILAVQNDVDQTNDG